MTFHQIKKKNVETGLGAGGKQGSPEILQHKFKRSHEAPNQSGSTLETLWLPGLPGVGVDGVTDKAR